jgi:hypothetical protein
MDENSVIWQQDGPLPTSQECDIVPESNNPGKVDRLWRLHSMATQITQPDTHRLIILGIHERCVHTTQATGPPRVS